MKFKLFDLFRKKSDSYRIAPAPESPHSDRQPIHSNNFFREDPATFFVILAGSAEAIASKLIPLQNVPLNQFYKDEIEAFDAAKKDFQKKAFSILKIKIDPTELMLITTTVKNTAVANINLIDVAQSIKGFSQRDPSFNNYKIFSIKQGISLEDLIETPAGVKRHL